MNTAKRLSEMNTAKRLISEATYAAQGNSNTAQRIVNAENAFIEFAMKQGELTKSEAEKALARYKKEKVIKIDIVGGQFTFKHGAFGDRDVLRRAAGVEQ